MNNPNDNDKSFPIVGIGASAGGLEATTRLLEALPVNLGMGFVLIQHLDPTHDSILASLLSKATTMPVKEASNNARVEPNHVYVIPHNKDMTIFNGCLKLTTRGKSKKVHMPIDLFFNSLAEDHYSRAIGVVLSGTATDGTLGLKAIKINGGITFAQDETAKYQGMPKSAAVSGYVDFVLSPVEIAKELERVSHYSYLKKPKTVSGRPQLSEDEKDLTEILFMLKKTSGNDFSNYKSGTIERRVKRRMLLCGVNTFKDYVAYLKDNNEEIISLHEDLLINVTSFFREPQTFKFLHDKVFPQLVKDRSSKETIRIWIPGCATGEEVYSIAMILRDFLTDKKLSIPIQLFGTDLRKSAIDTARKGIYSESEVSDVDSEYLTRFFDKVNGSYQVSKSIREFCIFAPHNVFADPPFSRLDLISCCNLLIYLDIGLQEQVFNVFHRALKPAGFLRLGKSETVGASAKIFSQINSRYKVYTKKEGTEGSVGDYNTSVLQTGPFKSTSNRITTNEVSNAHDVQKEAETILLSNYIPASVVINNDLEIIQFRGPIDAYLAISSGKASLNLLKLAREDLEFELREAVYKVKNSGNLFRKENIPLRKNHSLIAVNIEVLPLKPYQGQPYYLILFEDTKNVSQPVTSISDELYYSENPEKDRMISELELQLSQIRESLRTITEEHDVADEKLQTANEDILSSNEELQSINEELETSKEELESTNEELTSLNEELQNSNEQLVEARDYSDAIIGTVQVALLVLDVHLRVKTANRSFYKMFQVSEEDTIGNFVYDLGNGQWNIPSLRRLLNEVLPKNNVFDNQEIEHTFPKIGNRIMLLNARKFNKEGENILLAIEDITDLKKLEKHKDLFVGVVSHELKTPVTSMKIYAQVLEKRLLKRDDKKSTYLIQSINKQTDRLTTLINDLLSTSQIQTGKLILEVKKFDLNELVLKTVGDFQQITETHKIIIEGKVTDKISGDQNRIEQVLTNLITNAVKYSPQSDKVIIGLESDKNNITVCVQDFGIGIAKNDQERIFERFYRTGGTEMGTVSGFGLGLYIASEIIKEHGGKIWVESMKGKGSIFYFTLPINKATRF